MLVQKHSQRAASFWDANRERAKDPTFWMAHPICRAAINRRVSGSEHEWPLIWFQRLYGQHPFPRGISWGCGLGAFERWAVRLGIVREIDAFDVSAASLSDARRIAELDSLSSIHYKLGSFDELDLPEGKYDIALFHFSLHHVSNFEEFFEALSRILVPGGAIYLDEYIGRSRDRWRGRHLKEAQAILDRIPQEGKLHRYLDLPVEKDDPSEAVRSGEIVSFLGRYFDLVEFKPYGGQILSLIFPYLTAEWANSEEGNREIGIMLDIEERQLREDPSLSAHLVAYGTLKSARGAHNATGVKKRASIVRRRLRNLLRAGSRIAFHAYWLYFKVVRRVRARTFRHVS